jgi:purine-binding chemotaxis protein CheW
VPDERQFCTFFLAGHYFGIEVFQVQEVIRAQLMTRVPLAPPAVRGLINLRGQIVTVLDLRVRFRLEDRPPTVEPVNVVVRTAAGPVSLMVDDVGDVVRVPEGAFEYPPETLGGLPGELIRGVYKLDGRLLLVLDAARALDPA